MIEHNLKQDKEDNCKSEFHRRTIALLHPEQNYTNEKF